MKILLFYQFNNVADKIPLYLRPYDAIILMLFVEEYINAGTQNIPGFQAINEAVKSFSDQVCSNITEDQISDSMLEIDINNLTGRHPKKK